MNDVSKHRIHVLARNLRHRPRLLVSIAVGLVVLVGIALGTPWRASTRALIAWNAGAGLYVVLAWTTMLRSGAERMRARSKLHDEGGMVILIATAFAATLSLIAIVAELATTKDAVGWLKTAHISLGVVTLLSSWVFIHTSFAFHYAHAYYAGLIRNHTPCLEFPKTPEPRYSDFLYFAFVIGTSGQTADISFLTTEARQLGLIHCVLSFIFNTTVLALMINIAAGLI
ncbi:DUF1345 domain-containing protein [Siculibacillus lacustris]|uniref:DUF1345 domain-containing protein n=1 Tax=Siculibacillus lacustris TaxID=1549641 RepID=A0A4Q9VTH0_9HYPH|nr:DUF1345 domain-containing protein [Siculibacillus lacustris]TBW39006.1 DUF1345 domain-containing protein [Siculibacillus lacustris]